MKRTVFFLALMAIWQNVFAYDFSAVAPTGQTLYYMFLADSVGVSTCHPNDTATLYNTAWSGFPKPTGHLVIPDSVMHNGTKYPVKHIWGFAFCDSLVSVRIPDSSQISNMAFAFCLSLEKITDLGLVKKVGSRAFYYCTKLHVGNVSIYDMVMEEQTVDSAGYGIIFLFNIDSIGYQAFAHCTGISLLLIGEHDWGAGSTPTYIEYGAFLGVNSIGGYRLPARTAYMGDYDYAYFNGYYGWGYHWGAKSRGWLEGKGMVYRQEYDAEADEWYNPQRTLMGVNSTLPNVVIPNTVDSIKSDNNWQRERSQNVYNSYGCYSAVFQNCIIDSITIPPSVKYMDRFAFSGCNNLRRVNYNATNVSYTYDTMPPFAGCVNLEEVYVGANVSRIPNRLFQSCTSLQNIYFSGTTAPVLGSMAFSNIHPSAIFHVPCGSYDSYYRAGYANWGTIDDPIGGLGITVSSNDSFLGTASVVQQGGYRIACDSTTIIKAEGKTVNGVAASQFVRWSDGSTDSIRTLHLVGDTNLTAFFAPIVQCTITATCNDVSMGSVAGGGNYAYGDAVTLSATPAEHHHFVRWNLSDGRTSSDNPVSFRASENITWTARFAEDPKYYIGVYSTDDEMGSVEGEGEYYENEWITITAVPAPHYHFTQWSDGNTSNPRQVKVTYSRSYYAEFAPDQYTITVTSSDPLRGSVEGGGTFTYPEATTVSATAYSGYQFVRWSNGVGHNPYTFAVTADMDLVAVFIPEGTIYNITAVSENPSMGTVTGGGPYGVGERAVLTAIPEPGYQFDRWSDGSRQNPRTVTVSADAIRVWSYDGRIHVVGAEGMDVNVYDILGRRVSGKRKVERGKLELAVPAGVYLVRIGDLPARKVVVIKR